MLVAARREIPSPAQCRQHVPAEQFDGAHGVGAEGRSKGEMSDPGLDQGAEPRD